MADACGLDLDEIVQAKIREHADKYTVEKAYGSNEKYTEMSNADKRNAEGILID